MELIGGMGGWVGSRAGGVMLEGLDLDYEKRSHASIEECAAELGSS